jgi:hypothetical protein
MIWGIVEDNNDPLKIGRLKIRITGYYDQLPLSAIPWALPQNVAFNRLDVPPLKSEVNVTFINGEILAPIWWTGHGRSADDLGISPNDYISAVVAFYKDLSDYDKTGVIKQLFTLTDGLLTTYKHDDCENIFQLLADSTILLSNKKWGKLVHISNESISLGSMTRSAEPGVLGDKNFDALNNINDMVKEFAQLVKTYADSMAAACVGNSVLTALIQPNKQLSASVEAKTVKAAFSKNKNQFPSTKSTIVTLD